MAIFFIFVTNLLNLHRRTLIVHKLLSSYQGNKIKRLLKEKTKQNQFLPILSGAQGQTLEKICQKISS